MTTVHILASVFPRQSSGLDAWNIDLANALLRAGMKPIIYQLEDPESKPSPSFETVDVWQLRAPWEAPLLGSRTDPVRLERDRSRLNFACAKAAIARRAGNESDIIVSNFVTVSGFTAHLIADELGLPHVAVIAGSDFTRDFRSKIDRQVFQEVCGSARVVVGRSTEHLRALRRYSPGTPCQVIESSVELPTRVWAKPVGNEISIFSDGGFSFKKGTGVLMDAFAALRDSDVPARLTICGPDFPGQGEYWQGRRRLLEEHSGPAVHFPGLITPDEIVEQICAADIYASTSLGEGSSAARARALSMGVPVVSTACGNLTDDPGASHIRLVPPADAAAFHEALRALATDLLAGRVSVDRETVGGFRRRFDPDKEWAAWVSLLRAVGSDSRSPLRESESV
jgi:glycosyltransferase involved in cell wall biosynthesis